MLQRTALQMLAWFMQLKAAMDREEEERERQKQEREEQVSPAPKRQKQEPVQVTVALHNCICPRDQPSCGMQTLHSPPGTSGKGCVR